LTGPATMDGQKKVNSAKSSGFFIGGLPRITSTR
jgi:hypothetical protein